MRLKKSRDQMADSSTRQSSLDSDAIKLIQATLQVEMKEVLVEQIQSMTSAILEKTVAACSEQISEQIKHVIDLERKVLLDEVLNIKERLETIKRKRTDEVRELISTEFARLSEVLVVISDILDQLRKTRGKFEFYWRKFAQPLL